MRYILGFFFLMPIQCVIAQEICGNCIDDDGDGLIDCYDPECRNNLSECPDFYLGVLKNEMDLSTCNDHFELIEVLTIPGIGDGYDVLVGDVDNDGMTEIIAQESSGTMVIYNSSGILENSISGVPARYAFADVDKDGKAEFFIQKNAYQIARYEETLGAPIWLSDSSKPFGAGGYLSITDLDGNDTAEVLAAGAIYNSITGQLLADISADIFKYPAAYNWFPVIAADVLPDVFCIDCDGLELINGKRVFSVDLKNGKITQRVIMSDMGEGVAAVADFNGDGLLDIIVNDAFNNSTFDDTIYVYDPRTETLIAPLFIYNPAQNSFIGSPPLIGNIDNDPNPEILLLRDVLYAIDDDMTLKWKNENVQDLNSGYCTLTMFDFNCDEMQELVVRGGDGYIHILKGIDGKELARDNCSSATAGERPVVADVNNDGHADILCSCGEGLKVWTGAAPNNWAPARKVANQYGYFNVNINDDLTVPCKQQNHADKNLPSVLNSFLAQAPLMDSLGRTCKKNNSFADVLVRIDTFVYLSCDSANILFSICNIGQDSTIHAGMKYSIYETNGTKKYVKYTGSISEDILPNNCKSYNYITNIKNQTVYFYGNDNGSDTSSPPFSEFIECDYTNNADSITLINPVSVPIDLGADTVVCEEDSILLVAPDSLALWSTGFQGDTIYVAEGTYSVVIQYSEKCIQSDTINIEYQYCDSSDLLPKIFIPSAFSPNDDKVNDRLYVRTIGVQSLLLKIYDLHGRLLFQTDNMKTGWDGKANGHLVNSGVYLYTILAVTGNEELITQTGNLTVVY